MANSTGLSTAASPSLLAPAQSPGAFKNTIQRISAQGEAFALVAQVLNPMTDALNTLYRTLKQAVPQPEQYDVLDQSGNLAGFIGYTYSGNVLYEGAWFANLGIGGTIAAPIISVNGSTAQIVINSNGSIIIEDPSNNVTAEIGTIFDTTLNITSISSATAPVVTLSSTPAIPFTTGDTVTHAGNSVSQYNGNFTITVLTPTTYTMNGVTNHGAGTGGTSQRYFSGVAGERAAFGGNPFSPFSASIKTQADGSVIIRIPQNNVSTIIGNTIVLGTKIAGLITQDDGTKVETVITPETFFALDASGNILVSLNCLAGISSSLNLYSDPTSQYVASAGATFGSAAIVSVSGPLGTVEMGSAGATVDLRVFGATGAVATLTSTQLSMSDGSGGVVNLNTTAGLSLNVGSATGLLSSTSLSLNGGGVVIDSNDLTFTSTPTVTVGSGNVGQATVYPVAKLTTGGSNGSMTFVAGVLTAFTAPT